VLLPVGARNWRRLQNTGNTGESRMAPFRRCGCRSTSSGIDGGRLQLTRSPGWAGEAGCPWRASWQPRTIPRVRPQLAHRLLGCGQGPTYEVRHARDRVVAAAVRGVPAEGEARPREGGTALRPLGAEFPVPSGNRRAAGGPGAAFLRRAGARWAMPGLAGATGRTGAAHLLRQLLEPHRVASEAGQRGHG
jgi:hypothetical protein